MFDASVTACYFIASVSVTARPLDVRCDGRLGLRARFVRRLRGTAKDEYRDRSEKAARYGARPDGTVNDHLLLRRSAQGPRPWLCSWADLDRCTLDVARAWAGADVPRQAARSRVASNLLVVVKYPAWSGAPLSLKFAVRMIQRGRALRTRDVACRDGHDDPVQPLASALATSSFATAMQRHDSPTVPQRTTRAPVSDVPFGLDGCGGPGFAELLGAGRVVD